MMNVRTYEFNDELKMNYAVAFPSEYTDLPLLVYLHGAGERGKRLEHVYRHGIPKLIGAGLDVKAIVLYPQCPAGYIWNNMVKEVKALIDSVVAEYGVKRDRIVLTGSSMGGYGAWETAACYPETFAAIAPVAGGGVVWRTTKLKNLPVLVYHGSDDDVVPPSQSEIMAEFAARNGALVQLNILQGLGHNDGIDYAYEKTDLIERLLGYRKTDFSRVPEPCEELF